MSSGKSVYLYMIYALIKYNKMCYMKRIHVGYLLCIYKNLQHFSDKCKIHYLNRSAPKIWRSFKKIIAGKGLWKNLYYNKRKIKKIIRDRIKRKKHYLLLYVSFKKWKNEKQFGKLIDLEFQNHLKITDDKLIKKFYTHSINMSNSTYKIIKHIASSLAKPYLQKINRLHIYSEPLNLGNILYNYLNTKLTNFKINQKKNQKKKYFKHFKFNFKNEMFCLAVCKCKTTLYYNNMYNYLNIYFIIIFNIIIINPNLQTISI